MGATNWIRIRLGKADLIRLLHNVKEDGLELQIKCQNPKVEATELGPIKELSGRHEDILLKDVRHQAQAAWIAAYKDPIWIRQELLRAHAWIEANPRRRPKSFTKFFGAWLSRAYERSRKQVSSTVPESPTGQIFK